MLRVLSLDAVASVCFVECTLANVNKIPMSETCARRVYTFTTILATTASSYGCCCRCHCHAKGH